MVKQELSGLTTLRFWASLFVLGFHGRYFLEGTLLEIPFFMLFNYGSNGVDVFFILSGFVLNYVYHDELKTWQYLVKRFARVYPLFIVTTLLAYALVLVLGAPVYYQVGPPQFWQNILMVQGWTGGYKDSINFVSWSVSTEWFCYLLLPVMLPVFRKLPASWLLVVIPLAVYVFMPTELIPLFAGGLTRCFLEFLSGAMLFKVWNAGKDKLNPNLALWMVCLGVLLLIVVPGWLNDISGEVMASKVAAMGALPLVYGCTFLATSSRFSSFGGAMSYSLYLVHGVMYLLARRLWDMGITDQYSAILIFFAGSFLVSCATYLWIEVPSRKLIVSLSEKVNNTTRVFGK